MTPPASPVPAKKNHLILWILLGVGGLFALLLVIVVAGGMFLVHKAGLSGASIRVEDANKGEFQVKSADGSVQIGGRAKIPAWLPEYPGSHAQNAFSAQSKDSRGGTFMFQTKDSPDRASKYYRDQLEASGLSVAAVVNSGTSQIITAEDRDKHHTVTVVVAGGSNETSVNVTYTTNR
jgi:hypothetical protein